MTGCVTTPKENKIALPPKPEREEIAVPDNIKGYALLINYYEHLLEQWELWGETVDKMVENPR